ncbi:MAG: tetratricopeptide repeat protein, partial [Oscillospiraceae bacterium]|nr:tetratricopeptide repeat protein [Oscillospiraceae bacterium]
MKKIWTWVKLRYNWTPVIISFIVVVCVTALVLGFGGQHTKYVPIVTSFFGFLSLLLGVLKPKPEPPPPPLPPLPLGDKWLTQACVTDFPDYVERPALGALLNAMRDNRKVAMTGMGGIGKTTLLQRACRDVLPDVPHLGWVRYQSGSLAGSLLGQLYPAALETDLNRLLSRVNALGDKLLLFVDNIDKTHAEDETLALLDTLTCRVVISQRYDYAGGAFFPLPLPLPSEDECRDLFAQYYSPGKTVEDETSRNAIIQRAGRHPLALEIIAKTARQKGQSPAEALAELTEYGFDLNLRVGTRWNKDTQEEMMAQLSKLYRLSDIEGNPDRLYVVKNFAALPPMLPLARKTAIQWLGLLRAQENALHDLAGLGWLQHSESGFSMHNVVWEIVNRKAEITLADCEALVDALWDESLKDDICEARRLLPYIAAFCERFDNVPPLAGLYNNLSIRYADLGDNKAAMEWSLKDLAMMEQLYPDGPHPDLAKSYNNLSLRYADLGDNKAAMEWALKALAMMEQLYPDGPHPDLAASYGNLALRYADL